MHQTYNAANMHQRCNAIMIHHTNDALHQQFCYHHICGYPKDTFLCLQSCTYGSDSPGRGKWSKCGIFLFFLKLCCDQTVRVFQLLSTVLKRFCLVHPKNVSILVLAIFLIEQFSPFLPQIGDFWHCLRSE